jgi:hypothetical protein
MTKGVFFVSLEKKGLLETCKTRLSIIYNLRVTESMHSQVHSSWKPKVITMKVCSNMFVEICRKNPTTKQAEEQFKPKEYDVCLNLSHSLIPL